MVVGCGDGSGLVLKYKGGGFRRGGSPMAAREGAMWDGNRDGVGVRSEMDAHGACRGSSEQADEYWGRA